jgi:hypothetical protein
MGKPKFDQYICSSCGKRQSVLEFPAAVTTHAGPASTGRPDRFPGTAAAPVARSRPSVSIPAAPTVPAVPACSVPSHT